MKSIKEIAEILSSELSEKKLGNPDFNKDYYDSYHLDKSRFYNIESPKRKRKIVFIDGGNQELFPAPEYSVQINRVYFNIFENNQRIMPQSNIPQRIEFLSFTLPQSGEKNQFETRLSPVRDEFKKYLPNEEDLRTQPEDDVKASSQIEMENVASMAREFAEWKIAGHIMDSELQAGDIIVKDGTLRTSFKHETKLVKEIFKKAKEKKIIFTGLSKTCRLKTDTQSSLIVAIQRLADNSNINYERWCYYPIARSKKNNYGHNAVIMVVKLNKITYSPFRFEILKDQEDEMDKKEVLDIVSAIADNSKDIRLPGYPYGLIDAHIWARVKNEELESYKTRLYSELSKKGWKQFDRYMKTVDTHDEADKL